MRHANFVIALALAAVIAVPAMAQKTVFFGIGSPPRAHLVQQVFIPWSKKVSAESGGAIKVEVRAGRTLVSPFNVYERVQADVAQIGWGVQSFMKGRFRRSAVVGLPFEANTAEEASVALWRLYAKGVTAAEYKEVKPLAIIVFPPSSLHSKSKPIKSLADIKGMKIAVGDRLGAQVLKRLGAAPISLRLPEMYQGLNRGTVAGVHMVWTAFMPFKLFEVTAHHYDLPLGAASAMVFMSTKGYDALPAAGRKAIDANSGEAFSRSFGKFWDRVGRGGRGAVAKMPGHSFETMSSADVAEWRASMQPVVEGWKKGIPDGARILEAFRAELASIRAGK